MQAYWDTYNPKYRGIDKAWKERKCGESPVCSRNPTGLNRGSAIELECIKNWIWTPILSI